MASLVTPSSRRASLAPRSPEASAALRTGRQEVLADVVHRLADGGGPLAEHIADLKSRDAGSLTVEVLMRAIGDGLDQTIKAQEARRRSSVAGVHTAQLAAKAAEVRDLEDQLAASVAQCQSEAARRAAAEDFAKSQSEEVAAARRQLHGLEHSLREMTASGNHLVHPDAAPDTFGGLCPHCHAGTLPSSGAGNVRIGGASRQSRQEQRKLPEPGDNGVLDPRDLVKAMTVARASKADEIHRNFLRHRGVTPTATLRRQGEQGGTALTPEPTSGTGRDATPPRLSSSAQMPGMSSTPPPGKAGGLSSPADVGLGIQVNRLRGTHEGAARGPLPKTPLVIGTQDRWGQVAVLPVIGPASPSASPAAEGRLSKSSKGRRL
jgi:hypothetical protein